MSRRRGRASAKAKAKAKSGPRAKHHSMANRDGEDDAVAEWGEWLDHQYDPGYYTGGRIPPFLRNRGRPSAFGYVLLVFGALTLLLGVGTLLAGDAGFTSGNLVMLILGAAQLAAGWRLSRRAR